jgi:hypothetical protein
MSWIATILSPIGNLLVNGKCGEDFCIWIISSILWVIIETPNVVQVMLLLCSS